MCLQYTASPDLAVFDYLQAAENLQLLFMSTRLALPTMCSPQTVLSLSAFATTNFAAILSKVSQANRKHPSQCWRYAFAAQFQRDRPGNQKWGWPMWWNINRMISLYSAASSDHIVEERRNTGYKTIKPDTCNAGERIAMPMLNQVTASGIKKIIGK